MSERAELHGAPSPTNRRRPAATHRVAALIGLLAASAACSSDDDTVESVVTSSPVITSNPAVPSTRATDGESFPATIEHANGATEIEHRPERIVTVGPTDETVLLAFDERVVGYAGWWGPDLDLDWPWSGPRWADERPVLISTAAFEIDVEAVAALQPDLILGLWASADDEQYELYSAIAPTVIMGSADQQNVDFRAATTLVGEVLGEQEQAAQFIADLDARFDEVAAARPELAQTTAAFIAPGVDGSMWAYAPDDGRGQFLAQLGFGVDETLADAFDDGAATLQVSNERFDVFDDVGCLFVSIGDGDTLSSLRENPLYQAIPAVRDGCVVELLGFGDHPPITAALATNNVLSLTWALEQLGPLLDELTIPS